MKHLISLLAIVAVTITACHKKTSTPAAVAVINNTVAQANVANAIDSAAVNKQHEKDVYDGSFKAYNEYGQFITDGHLEFYLTHLIPNDSTKPGLAVFNCEDEPIVPLSADGDYFAKRYIADTIKFIGKGIYNVHYLSYDLRGGQIGDSLIITWVYYDYTRDAYFEHLYTYRGTRMK